MPVPANLDEADIYDSPPSPTEGALQWGLLTAAGVLAVSLVLILIVDHVGDANDRQPPYGSTPTNVHTARTPQGNGPWTAPQAPAEPATRPIQILPPTPPVEQPPAAPAAEPAAVPVEPPPAPPVAPPPPAPPVEQPPSAPPVQEPPSTPPAEPRDDPPARPEPLPQPQRVLATLPTHPGETLQTGLFYLRFTNTVTETGAVHGMHPPEGSEWLSLNLILHRQQERDLPFARRHVVVAGPDGTLYPLTAMVVRNAANQWQAHRLDDNPVPLPAHWSASPDDGTPRNRWLFAVPPGSQSGEFQLQIVSYR